MIQGSSITAIQANTLMIDQAKDSIFYISKLESLKNQPKFTLDINQFENLKKEFTKLTEKQWKETEHLLKTVVENQGDENKLIPFLVDRGIRVGMD